MGGKTGMGVGGGEEGTAGEDVGEKRGVATYALELCARNMMPT